MNQQAYNSNSYGEDGFIGLSTLAHYIDFEIDQPTQRLFYLQEHQVDSDELFFNPGWFDSTEKSIYSWNTSTRKDQSRSAGGAILQVNPDVVINKRSVYNMLDLLGDVGGLKEALYLLSSFILFVCGQRDRISSYLIQEVYERANYKEKDAMHKIQDISDIN